MALKKSSLALAVLPTMLLVLAEFSRAQPSRNEPSRNEPGRGPASAPGKPAAKAPAVPPKTGQALHGSAPQPKPTTNLHTPVQPTLGGRGVHAGAGGGTGRPNSTQSKGEPVALGARAAGSAARGAGNFKIGPSTTLTLHPRAPSMTITKVDSDGPTVVVKQRYAGGQPQVLSAYTSRTNAVTGTVTRTYLDGHVLESGRGFSRFEIPGRYSVTTQSNGLRQASGIGGKPLYRDSYETRVIGGVAMQFVVRSIFSETLNDQVVDYPDPMVRMYAVQTYHGVRVLAYQPVQFEPGFYGPLLAAFPQPLVVDSACGICPAPVVAFENPVREYSDPLALVGDLQIAGAYTDSPGVPASPGDPSAAPPPADPDVDYLSQKVSDLQREVDAAKSDDPQLNHDIDSMPPPPPDPPAPASPPAGSPPASIGSGPATTPAATATPAPNPAPASSSNPPPPPPGTTPSAPPKLQSTVAYVPEDVRRQIHAQVRENVRLHEEKQPLTWAGLVNSGQSKSFIFQVSEVISTVSTNGEDCALTGGDMLKMAENAAPDDPAIRMRVINSKPNSCAASTIVSVSVADVQNMLNDFNARQENNMRQVHKKLTGTTQI